MDTNKISDRCTCQNRCSSSTRGFEYFKINSVSKRLLLALSVVVILAMCVMPAEAASIEHKRHRLQEQMAKATKDTGASRTELLMRDHRRRHQRALLKNTTHSTKEPGSLRRLSSQHYETARTKIGNKVKYTKDNFVERRKTLTEPKEYGSGMPTWLPKTNFVDIHFHHFRIGRKNDPSKPKRIFVFLIRKLYKSLLKYHELFKIFKRIEVVSPDTQITNYNIKRHDFLTKTTDDLYSTIEDIKDAMVGVRMTEPKVDLSQMKLNTIELRVDSAKYLKNDDILLRAYGNLLDNWYLEFNCSKSGENRKVRKCLHHDNSLREKRNKRKRNKRRKQQA